MSQPPAEVTLERSWRLLPSEKVLWHGKSARGVARDPAWHLGAALLLALASVAALFSALLWVTELPGVAQTALMSAYLTLFGLGLALAPRYLHDPCEYVVTDRRVMWRRGRVQRWIDRHAISYGRIHWNRTTPGVGHLELVRAAPFGPLARKQRLKLLNVHAPDRVLARIRDAEPTEHMGDAETALTDRLDRDEQVLWGGGPQGWLVGWRDGLTAVAGLAVLVMAVSYSSQAWGVLIHLETLGLQVKSWTWLLLFLPTGISCGVMLSVSTTLLWHGIWRARAMGRDTEYVVTDRRVLIRRGRTELSLDRRTIVDVAVVPLADGCRHMYLILDAPEARALSDSGALTPLPPARDLVAPVLYELRETDKVYQLLLGADPDSYSEAA